ncbi:MAG: DUF4389 domain-containing protein [Immundisolibacteraceae bacterium]|nr:DUF4389 domain-containing protein [Immundisolibacteraceae bacterium]
MSSQPSASDRISTLMRILLSLLFLFIYSGLLMLIGLVSAVGLLVALVTGNRPPIALTRLADRTVCYSGQIANYLIWVDGEAPFPFNPLPPASDLFTQRIDGTNSDYVGADDVTITSVGGNAIAGIYADAEDDTFVSSFATQGPESELEMDLELGDDGADEIGQDETTQLNPDKDPEELLDDTVLQPPQSEESINRASADSAMPAAEDPAPDVEEESEVSGEKSAKTKDESLTSQK